MIFKDHVTLIFSNTFKQKMSQYYYFIVLYCTTNNNKLTEPKCFIILHNQYILLRLQEDGNAVAKVFCIFFMHLYKYAM